MSAAVTSGSSAAEPHSAPGLSFALAAASSSAFWCFRSISAWRFACRRIRSCRVRASRLACSCFELGLLFAPSSRRAPWPRGRGAIDLVLALLRLGGVLRRALGVLLRFRLRLRPPPSRRVFESALASFFCADAVTGRAVSDWPLSAWPAGAAAGCGAGAACTRGALAAGVSADTAAAADDAEGCSATVAVGAVGPPDGSAASRRRWRCRATARTRAAAARRSSSAASAAGTARLRGSVGVTPGELRGRISRRDHHDQLGLVLLRRLALEQQAENRDVADARESSASSRSRCCSSARRSRTSGRSCELELGFRAARAERGDAEAVQRRRRCAKSSVLTSGLTLRCTRSPLTIGVKFRRMPNSLYMHADARALPPEPCAIGIGNLAAGEEARFLAALGDEVRLGEALEQALGLQRLDHRADVVLLR